MKRESGKKGDERKRGPGKMKGSEARKREKKKGEREREMAALSQPTIAPQSSWDILIRERELIRIPCTAQAPESHL